MIEHEHKVETRENGLDLCACGAWREVYFLDNVRRVPFERPRGGEVVGPWQDPKASIMFLEAANASETITKEAPPIWIDEAWERARVAPSPEQVGEVEREEVSIVCEDAKRLDGGFMEKLLARYAQAMLPPDDIPKGLRREERLAHIAGELLPARPYAVLAFEDERRGILRLQFLEHADPQTAERFRRIAASHLALTLAIEVGAARP